jgi:hypothetical protein
MDWMTNWYFNRYKILFKSRKYLTFAMHTPTCRVFSRHSDSIWGPEAAHSIKLIFMRDLVDPLIFHISLFSLSSLIFMLDPLIFHSSSSICFSFIFDLYSFYYYLFYLKLFITLDFFFNFILLYFFFPSIRFSPHSYDCYLFYLR